MEFKEAPKSWRERRKKESCPIGKAMMHLRGGKRLNGMNLVGN